MNKKHLFAAVVVLPLLAVGLQLAFADEPPAPPGPPPGAIVVEIDIKPGSYPNSINLGSHGLVPVAILSEPNPDPTKPPLFDATTVAPETVVIAGSAKVAVRGNGKKELVHQEDVNADGLLDLVLQVETENLATGQWQDGYVQLLGNIDSSTGPLIWGYDEITIVPQ